MNPYASILRNKPLTDKELQVAKELCKGKKNMTVALDIGISVKTVEKHRYRINDKVGEPCVLAILKYLFKHNHLTVEEFLNTTFV